MNFNIVQIKGLWHAVFENGYVTEEGRKNANQARSDALERLRDDLDQSDKLLERRAIYDKEPTALQIKIRLRIKAEIAALESRI